jgi:hypothetical protein
MIIVHTMVSHIRNNVAQTGMIERYGNVRGQGVVVREQGSGSRGQGAVVREQWSGSSNTRYEDKEQTGCSIPAHQRRFVPGFFVLCSLVCYTFLNDSPADCIFSLESAALCSIFLKKTVMFFSILPEMRERTRHKAVKDRATRPHHPQILYFFAILSSWFSVLRSLFSVIYFSMSLARSRFLLKAPVVILISRNLSFLRS